MISVVIPTYNRPDFLIRAIDSVSKQTCRDLEIVISDDGSTESLDHVVGRIPDIPIRIVRSETRRGAYLARHAGVLAAAGQYIAFLDSDDWWDERKLELQLSCAETHPDTLISCRLYAAHEERLTTLPSRVIGAEEDVAEYVWLQGGFLQSSTLFAPRKIMIEAIGRSMEVMVHTDTAICINIRKCGYKIFQMEDFLVYFDASKKHKRMGNDPALIKKSIDFFNMMAGEMSAETKDAFHFNDTSMRLANCGRKRDALVVLFRHFRWRFGVYGLAYKIVRTLLR